MCTPFGTFLQPLSCRHRGHAGLELAEHYSRVMRTMYMKSAPVVREVWVRAEPVMIWIMGMDEKDRAGEVQCIEGVLEGVNGEAGKREDGGVSRPIKVRLATASLTRGCQHKARKAGKDG